MQKLVVTGGAGFIGSALVHKLNTEGIDDIIIVDNLSKSEKWRNLLGLRFSDYLHKNDFLTRISTDTFSFAPQAIVHMGACSQTTMQDADYLMENNYRYTRVLADWAVSRGVRFIYASSAATYGDGSAGFSDDHAAAHLREAVPLALPLLAEGARLQDRVGRTHQPPAARARGAQGPAGDSFDRPGRARRGARGRERAAPTLRW